MLASTLAIAERHRRQDVACGLDIPAATEHGRRDALVEAWLLVYSHGDALTVSIARVELAEYVGQLDIDLLTDASSKLSCMELSAMLAERTQQLVNTYYAERALADDARRARLREEQLAHERRQVAEDPFHGI